MSNEIANQMATTIHDLEAQLAEMRAKLKQAVADVYAARNGANCAICKMPTTREEIEHRCQTDCYSQDCGFIWRYDERSDYDE